MRIRTKALVLSSIKYSDSSLIVKAFTQSDGLKSYLLRGVLASKKSKIKAAYFLPLSQLELIAIHKNKGSLERILEVKSDYHYQSIHSDLIKNSLVIFLSEVLASSIIEEEANESLYEFLSQSFIWLDQQAQTGVFHLQFLLELSRYLGFYPDLSSKQLPYFNLLEGAFNSDYISGQCMNAQQSEHLKLFLGTNFDKTKAISLDKKDKKELLNSVVQYYQMHLNSFKSPKSIEVLNAVFSTK